MEEDDFLAGTVARLAGLPGVVSVSLGGSRAQGTYGPDSDWDLAIYYRDMFDPQTLRDVGWVGEVSEIGAWGGGVFNGGAWLQIDGRHVDVHYRDLNAVEHEISEAEHGRFRIKPLLFHLAGIPSYLVVGELAINRVLRGSLPHPTYPAALREHAPQVWWANARLVFEYAAANHARHGRIAQCVGLLVQAATQSAHAVLAARGEWVTNEKTLLTHAGLDAVNNIIADLDTTLDGLNSGVVTTRDLCAETLRSASAGRWPSFDVCVTRDQYRERLASTAHARRGSGRPVSRTPHRPDARPRAATPPRTPGTPPRRLCSVAPPPEPRPVAANANAAPDTHPSKTARPRGSRDPASSGTPHTVAPRHPPRHRTTGAAHPEGPTLR